MSITKNDVFVPLLHSDISSAISQIATSYLLSNNRSDNEKYFSHIFKNSIDGILVSAADGTILYANASAFSILGRTPEELCGIGWLDIPNPGSSWLFEASEKTGDSNCFNFEMNVRRNDGTKIAVEISVSKYSDQCDNIYFVTSLRDTKKKAPPEGPFFWTEQQLTKAFQANPQPMVIYSIEKHKIINVNDSFIEQYRSVKNEWLGLDTINLNNWVNENNLKAFRDTLMTQGIVTNFGLEMRIKGVTSLIQVSGVLISYKDEECFLVIGNDVDSTRFFHKQIARLDRLNLIGEMAASISHEIRNPMTTVRGLLQYFKEKDRYAQDLEYMDLMIEEVDRANSIITDFLSLAKTNPVEMNRRSLNKRIKALRALLQADATINDINIRFELSDIPHIIFDKNQVQQLIINLVRNALDASPPGGNVIIKTFKEQDHVVLAVQDQGEGIPPEVMEYIGTPFFTTKNNGTGLGLAVCFSIAERHGAQIDIDTGESGTTFNVRFKADQSFQLLE